MFVKLFNILCCTVIVCATLLITPQCIATTASYSVETVPNPRLQDRSNHVSDPSSLLVEDTVSYINQKLNTIESQQGIQSAVVILPSIGKQDVFEFSQELFRSWGIGTKNKNDGLLVLYVDDQHYIRFHTGYGLEGSLPDAICKRIQMQNMIPSFKQGKIDEGMKAGIDAICLRLTDPEKNTLNDNKTIDDDDDFEFFLYTTLGTIFVIFLSAAGIIIHNLNRKCPRCGKRRTLKTIKQEEVSGVKQKWLYITKKCSNCGYEMVIKYDISGRESSFRDDNSSDFGGNSGGSGGSYGGGSSGGGGAGSHW